MEIGPVQNNESVRKGTCNSTERQKGVQDDPSTLEKLDPTRARAALGDLADRTLTNRVEMEGDSYVAGATNEVETAAEEAQLYDQLADSLSAGRSRKGLTAGAVSNDGKTSRLDLVRQRIAAGFYESQAVKEMIAQKLADEFEGLKPQQDET